MKEQVSRLLVQYLLLFHLIGYTGERPIPGLETERLDIANFVFGSNKSFRF